MAASFALHLLNQIVLWAWVFPALVAAEGFLPCEASATGDRLRALGFWALYAVASAATFTAVEAALGALGLRPLVDLDLTPGDGWLHIPLLIGAAFVVSMVVDFFYYWTHRAQHRFFWRVHSVHHAIEDLSAVNSYHHWAEELTRIPLLTLPLYFIGVHSSNGVYLGALLSLQTWWIHTPLKFHYGPLRRILNDNHAHRIHHSIEPQHQNKNFGGFSMIWDQLFGTAYFPARGEWPETGLNN